MLQSTTVQHNLLTGENIDGQHLRPPVLAILLETIERKNCTTISVNIFPHQKIALQDLHNIMAPLLLTRSEKNLFTILPIWSEGDDKQNLKHTMYHDHGLLG